jgi:hypothetical protein
MRALAVMVAVVVVLGGCSSSSLRSTPSVLLPDVGAGYRLVPPSGGLSKDALAASTVVPKADMASYLRTASWRSAGERVWTSGEDEFVTDIVATFDDRAGASGLVSLAATVLPGPATRAFDLPDLPSAKGFVQTSDVRGRTMFCVIVFAASGVRAFVLTRCTTNPQDTATVSRLLVQQLARS